MRERLRTPITPEAGLSKTEPIAEIIRNPGEIGGSKHRPVYDGRVQIHF